MVLAAAAAGGVVVGVVVVAVASPQPHALCCPALSSTQTGSSD